MLRHVLVLCLVLIAARGCDIPTGPNKNWWKTTVFYQIYPRSFKDSDGDGIGDLNGITSKLEHLVDAGVGALWLSPIYCSPMVDFGYDISDFRDIDPIFGTMEDFDKLSAKAKQLGLKVIMDFVPNHSSDEHEWFKKSVAREPPYDDYYIWKDGKEVDGEIVPPNNWLSVFQGSAWQWNEERGQFYLHQFATAQPDLNYRNDKLREEMNDILTFWVDKGIDGFRIDAISHLIEDAAFADEPLSNDPAAAPDDHAYLDHIYTRDLQGTYEILKTWREHLDNYTDEHNTDAKVIMTEAYSDLPLTMKYYEYGADMPFNFKFITDLRNGSTAADYKRVIESWINDMPEGNLANWVLGNHDQPRAATRFGRARIEQMTMLTTVLPGVAVTYNGDEIGMENTWLSYEETVDPAACNTDEDRYESRTRDPQRTPFQWDATINAGFSDNETNKTWLPVNENYLWLNLEAQKATPVSHYRVYQALASLRKSPVLRKGSLDVRVIGDHILAVVRKLKGAYPVTILINFSESTQSVDVKEELDIPLELTVYTASIHSTVTVGSSVLTDRLVLPALASIVLTSNLAYDKFHPSQK